MTDRPTELFLWLDLETTGLDPEQDEIVEVGAILTDADLDECAKFSLLVVPSRSGIVRMMRDDTVRQMHEESGLLDSLVEFDGEPVEDIEEVIVEWVDYHAESDARIILAGLNVDAFDRQFLNRWMPTLAARLHYHGHDVGAHLTTYRHAGDPLEWKPGTAHRALDDARAALDVERQVRAKLAKRAALAALADQADELSAYFEREAWAEPPEPSYIYQDGRTSNRWAARLELAAGRDGERVEFEAKPDRWLPTGYGSRRDFEEAVAVGVAYRIVEGGDRS